MIFPQMLGEAFGLLEKFKRLPQPIMVVTSEFGTVSMWDWEINSFLSADGVRVIGPTSLEKTRQVCRAFALKRQLKRSKLLVYQDHPAKPGPAGSDLQALLLVGAAVRRGHREEVRYQGGQAELQEAG